MIRTGIMGTGYMAGQRAATLAALTDVDVCAVCSRSADSAQTLAGAHGATAYTDYQAMLADVDAVVVCTPNHLHAGQVSAALRAGVHVLVEYPLCLTADEADDLTKLADAGTSVLMVGNTMIHEAMYAYIDGHRDRLGTLISAASRVALYSPKIAGLWYLDPQCYGSPFVSYLYHHLEYYRRLLGPASRVWAHDMPEGVGASTGGCVTLEHASAATSHIQWYLHPQGDGLPRGLWLNGTQSSLTVVSVSDTESQVIWDQGGDGRCERLVDEWGVGGSSGDFVAAVTGSLDWRQRLRDDLGTLRTAFAAVESLRTHAVCAVELD